MHVQFVECTLDVSNVREICNYDPTNNISHLIGRHVHDAIITQFHIPSPNVSLDSTSKIKDE